MNAMKIRTMTPPLSGRSSKVITVVFIVCLLHSVASDAFPEGNGNNDPFGLDSNHGRTIFSEREGKISI